MLARKSKRATEQQWGEKPHREGQILCASHTYGCKWSISTSNSRSPYVAKVAGSSGRFWSDRIPAASNKCESVFGEQSRKYNSADCETNTISSPKSEGTHTFHSLLQLCFQHVEKRFLHAFLETFSIVFFHVNLLTLNMTNSTCYTTMQAHIMQEPTFKSASNCDTRENIAPGRVLSIPTTTSVSWRADATPEKSIYQHNSAHVRPTHAVSIEGTNQSVMTNLTNLIPKCKQQQTELMEEEVQYWLKVYHKVCDIDKKKFTNGNHALHHSTKSHCKRC